MPRITIESIIKLREDIENLQGQINFLEMENFEYALQCNRLKNILSSIKTLTREGAPGLVEVSGNVAKILEEIDEEHPSSALNDTAIERNISKNQKAQVVNPHMVNGTILYTPTINLTRVANVPTVHTSANQSEDEASSTQISDAAFTVTDQVDNEIDSTTNDTPGEPQVPSSSVRDSQEVPSAKRPRHSALLSGTFQEVKIFVSPVRQERQELSSEENTRRSNFVQRRRHRKTRE